jgi:hypothetical protein
LAAEFFSRNVNPALARQEVAAEAAAVVREMPFLFP